MLESKLEDIRISDIIPQREPFVLIDRLLSCSDDEVVTRFEVRNGSLFAPDGYLLAPGIIENMAQSCVAGAGYKSAFILHEPVEIGVIGEVRSFRLLRNPLVGEVLTTRIIVKGRVGGITISDAEVSAGGEVIATASFKTA